MKLRPAVCWLVLVPSLALAGDGPQRADVPRGADPPALVDPGVHVELSLTPGHARAESPLAFAFTIRDKTTALPLAGLRPAAWLSTRTEAGAASGRDCVRKAATFIGGSLMHRPALDLNAYYVLALNDDASVSVVDPRFGFGGSQLLAMLRLESRGEDWTLSPDGSRLFVSMPDAGKIAVADTVSWEVTRGIEVGPRPTRVALQPDGSQLWALTDDGLTAIDVRSLDVAGRIVAPGASAFAFTTDSRSVAVAASGGVIVAGTRGRGDAPARVVLSFTPRALAFSPAAQLAYAANPITGAIAAVDLATRTVVARLEAEPGFTQLRFSPNGRYGFLPNPEARRAELRYGVQPDRPHGRRERRPGPGDLLGPARLHPPAGERHDPHAAAQSALDRRDQGVAGRFHRWPARDGPRPLQRPGGFNRAGARWDRRAGRESGRPCHLLLPRGHGGTDGRLQQLLARAARGARRQSKPARTARRRVRDDGHRRRAWPLRCDPSSTHRASSSPSRSTSTAQSVACHDRRRGGGLARVGEEARREGGSDRRTAQMARRAAAGSRCGSAFDCSTRRPVSRLRRAMSRCSRCRRLASGSAAKRLARSATVLRSRSRLQPATAVYYVWVASASAGLPVNKRQFLVLRVE